jgi:hypothetical protein
MGQANNGNLFQNKRMDEKQEQNLENDISWYNSSYN